MRIMIDTNIIVSAALFPAGRVSAMLKELVRQHELSICTFSLEELVRVVDRKFKHKKNEVDAFLNELSYDLIFTPRVLDRQATPEIRDPKDFPILLSAISADVDVLISGDNDFSCVDCERPEILSPGDFRNKYL
jgi:putative PIN family toxin of toxin-antitoxin system